MKIFVSVQTRQRVSILLAPRWLSASTPLTGITFRDEGAVLLTLPAEKDKEMYLWVPNLG